MPEAFADLKAFFERVGRKAEARLRPIVESEIRKGLNLSTRIGLFPISLAESEVQAITSGDPVTLVSWAASIDAKLNFLAGNPRTAAIMYGLSLGLFGLHKLNELLAPGQEQGGSQPPDTSIVVTLPPMWLRDP